MSRLTSTLPTALNSNLSSDLRIVVGDSLTINDTINQPSSLRSQVRIKKESEDPVYIRRAKEKLLQMLEDNKTQKKVLNLLHTDLTTVKAIPKKSSRLK